MYPEKLNIEIGGYQSPSYKVVWEDGSLQYHHGNSFGYFREPEVIYTTEEHWKSFWEELDRINVWNWKESYESDILDGTQWSIEIVKGDKSLKSYGNNSYPKGDGQTSGKDGYQTDLLQDFLKAISGLIRKNFGG